MEGSVEQKKHEVSFSQKGVKGEDGNSRQKER